MHRPASKSAIITGASSGIGAAFARRLAAEAYDLVLIARRQERLASLAADVRQRFHVHVEVLVGDLSNPDDVARVEQHIARLDTLELLINNAGFGVPGPFAAVPLDTHLAMIEVHVLASVRFCRAALPGMIARGHGAIINLSSIGAFIPNPGDATYCATKAYLTVFSEALQAEVRGAGVRVQALCPGFTSTAFHDKPVYAGYDVPSRIPRALWMSADAVVAESLAALKKGRVICVPGFKNRVLVRLGRLGLTPLLLDWMVWCFPHTAAHTLPPRG
jgi:short-subunit dehydrogenase